MCVLTHLQTINNIYCKGSDYDDSMQYIICFYELPIEIIAAPEEQLPLAESFPHYTVALLPHLAAALA